LLEAETESIVGGSAEPPGSLFLTPLSPTSMRVITATVFAAAASSGATNLSRNPIRRVVSMLQDMQKKIEAEGKAQEKAFHKFQCYCETNTKELTSAMVEGQAKLDQLGSDIEGAEAARKQTLSDLAGAKEDREEANKAIEDSEEMREKENKDFTSESGELKANIEAMGNAITAISKGMTGSFLQTPTASVVNRLVANSPDLTFAERDQVQSYLQAQSTGGYAPASGQIVGILKQMKETMEKNLAELTAQESDAVASFSAMKSAKQKEIAAATASIEEKTQQAGDLAVRIVQLKDDKKDTADSLAADTGYHAELEKSCKEQVVEYDEIVKSRSEELVAISDTIKVLNDDDALELFKKAMPALVQVEVSQRELQRKALDVLRKYSHGKATPVLDLVAVALHGKKANFDKVLKMVDDMMSALKKEQSDDDAKNDYCKAELDRAEDTTKELKHGLSNLATRMQTQKDETEKIKTEIKELSAGIKQLDKAVDDATETRKEEHEAYVQAVAEDRGAVQILDFARNRLNKFYNKAEYKAPPKRELTEEERIYSAYGGDIGTTPAPGGIANTGAMAFVQFSARGADAPPPAPEVGGYKKSSGQSSGVLALMDMMIHDLKKEMQEQEHEEKNAQEDYEKLMKDSAAKRAADSASISEKEGALAELEDDMNDARQSQRSKMGQLEDSQKYTVDLHKTCDFLLENYGARKEARENEMEGLKKAKEVLSGADFGLVQTKSFLKRQ